MEINLNLVDDVPLTFLITDTRKSYCSVEFAASVLQKKIQLITKQWITTKNIQEGSVIRISIVCVSDVETNSDISASFISNLSNNHKVHPDIERALYISREAELGLISYGSCISLSTIEEIHTLSGNMSPDIIAIGGEAFTSNSNTILSGWIIPLLEIRSHKRQLETKVDAMWPFITLAANLHITSQSTSKIKSLDNQITLLNNLLSDIIWNFHQNLTTYIKIPPLLEEIKNTGINYDEYSLAIKQSLQDMEDGKLKKIVYATKKTGKTTSPIDPAALLFAIINENKIDNHKRFTFLYAPHGLHQDIFISLSPELLCQVKGSQIITEALAGTFSPETIKLDGTNDDKTCREHGSVTKFILNKLSELGGEVIIQEKELLQLKNLSHFKQILKTNATDPILHSNHNLVIWAKKHLHPTPAVCGDPVNIALQNILTYENMERELYSSYCGIITNSGGELFVGLRSAKINKNTIDIYAGAGIVLGSIAENEWSEMELKMTQYVNILTTMSRPAMTMSNSPSQSFPNITAAMSAMIIEEMLRQDIGAFCVCPGSRCTPLAVAIHRNSVARNISQICHDERAAGFYALGCARAGVLCAIIVTSGTAVSNLFPAICEAREAGLAIVLLTADRSGESRDVGEEQTIRQDGIFKSYVGWDRDYPPLNSHSIRTSASLLPGILSDISYGIGDIAKRRSQSVQLNFQFLKEEIDPVVNNSEFPIEFPKHLPLKIKKWMSHIQPYTAHHSLDHFLKHSNGEITRILEWIKRERSMWSIVVVCGHLVNSRDSIELKWFCDVFRIPCICDCTSMITSSKATGNTTSTNLSDCVFLGVDRYLASPLLAEALSTSVRMIIRVGGSLISAKVLDWMSKQPLATVLRVMDDGYGPTRHDQTWISDHYIHSPLCTFLQTITSIALPVLPNPIVQDCPALLLLQSTRVINENNIMLLAENPQFSEPQISTIIQEESDGISPIYLSSSMPCRDFDAFSGSHTSTRMTRRIGCNRGANGIDGVISTAVGYSFACGSAETPVTVLIGDVATMHDLTGIAIAAGTSPGNRGFISVLGGGRVGKIVCVNNSGGAIFSFLPASQFRHDFFTPFIDTPHNLHLSSIAAAITTTTPLQSQRVTSAEQLRIALRNKDVLFIECFNLPSNEENVIIHKELSKLLVEEIEAKLVDQVVRQIKWTYHSAKHDIKSRSSNDNINGDDNNIYSNSNISSTNSINSNNNSYIANNNSNSNDVAVPHNNISLAATTTSSHSHSTWSPTLPLVVLLHGWLGSQQDWSNLLLPIQQQLPSTNILTIDSSGDVLTANIFCQALRHILLCLSPCNNNDNNNNTTTSNNGQFTSRVNPVIFIGYSQGARLAMHYQSMYKQDVLGVLTLSSAPGKTPSLDFEASVLKLWKDSEEDVEHFLSLWYTLPVFSDLRHRVPEKYAKLVIRRAREGLDLPKALRNMMATATTISSCIQVALCGGLDNKYIALAEAAHKNSQVHKIITFPNFGHALLVEAPVDQLVDPIVDFISHYKLPYSLNNCQIICKKILISSIEIPLKSPLVVITNGKKKSFQSRNGIRIVLQLHKVMKSEMEELEVEVENDKSNYSGVVKDNKVIDVAIGVGECYEPVFTTTTNTTNITTTTNEWDIATMLNQITSFCESLEGKIFTMSPIPTEIVHQLILLLQPLPPFIKIGLEQCMLQAFAGILHISLVHLMAIYLNQPKFTSHVCINSFTTIRNQQVPKHTTTTTNNNNMVNNQQIIKMKIGNEQGTQAKEDAIRINDYVTTANRKDTHWLRLDANQSWEVEQATEFANTLSIAAIQAIQYIEEPLRYDCHVAKSYVELFHSCEVWKKISVALDETLCYLSEYDHDNNKNNLSAYESVTAIIDCIKNLYSDGSSLSRLHYVVKPSLLSLQCSLLQGRGNNSECNNELTTGVNLCNNNNNGYYNKNNDGGVTISCTFESGISLAYQICIASCYGEGSVHGIHANNDMIAIDEFTKQFSLLMEQDEYGVSFILVSKAENFLQKIAGQFLQDF